MNPKILCHIFVRAIALAALLIPLSAHAAAGDLYVSDFSSGAIYKITPVGARSTFASALDHPAGLAFDHSGNLFVSDGTGSILKFSPAGVKSTFASGLTRPGGLAFDGAGNLFVGDMVCAGEVGCGTILKFTPSGVKSTFASGINNTVATLVFHHSGDLYVTNPGPIASGAILKFTPIGDMSASVIGGNPIGLAFDNSSNLFVGDGSSAKILKLTSQGQTVFASDVDGLFCFDGNGNLFLANASTASILKFTSSGTRSTFASGFAQPDSLAFEPVTEKLRNISARGFVQTGDNVLIAGLIVGGNALANNAVVIRAIGPSLSHSGITNPLQDPTLELHNSSGVVIASNNDWQDTQEAQITRSGLAPSDAHESAIYATLPAGAYTAVVRGSNDTTGVALVEVYSLSR